MVALLSRPQFVKCVFAWEEDGSSNRNASRDESADVGDETVECMDVITHPHRNVKVGSAIPNQPWSKYVGGGR